MDRSRRDGGPMYKWRDGLALDGRENNSFIVTGVKADEMCSYWRLGGGWDHVDILFCLPLLLNEIRSKDSS